MLKSLLVAVSAALIAFSSAQAQSSDVPAAIVIPPTPAGAIPTLERIANTPKGELKNPYSDEDPVMVEAGRKVYFKSGCNGCHGGGGGGGMCPALSNDTWVYGGDDDTLFRLIALGSNDLMAAGYARKGRENIQAPMMAHSAIVKNDDDMWRIITYIRSNYRGGPTKKFGDQPKQAAGPEANGGG